MNVGKSGKFQEYFIKIPGVSRKKLENQIPGLPGFQELYEPCASLQITL
jgi:hypothetical protein